MMSDEQILKLGLEALISKLGPIGMIRFIHQFEAGTGDYTEDRYQWLDVSDVETLAAQIQQQEENSEYIVRTHGPVIDKRQDDAMDGNNPIIFWADMQEEEKTLVELETEDLDQSSILSFHIGDQIQDFAYTTTSA